MTSADVVDLVLAVARANPSHPAVNDTGGTVSYAEFERRIRRFAGCFAVAPRPCVLIALRQGVDAYAAMFGALLCGGYYAPVNIAAPIAKLQRIAAVLRPDFVVSDDTLFDSLGTTGAVHVDPARASAAALFEGRRPHDQLAYVIFTSGSTGLPKGVLIPRQALNHYVAWIRSELNVAADDRVSQYANIGFDLSVMEIFGGLCSGATIVPASGLADRLRPAEMIAREHLSVWVSVPSAISMMMTARHMSAENLGSVRMFVHCGEPLLPEHLEAIFGACPDSVVYNTYGPTEATVSVTSNRLTAGDYRQQCRTSVALGAPIQDMTIELVGDTADQGEIVIIGPQVALGYLGDAERTDRAFRTVGSGEHSCRGYFTGDLAERHDGRLFFKERRDRQAKIRGFRVELDEIETAIRELGWVRCCVFKSNEVLAAVLETAPCAFDAADIRRRLRESLEDYKIPVYITEIDQIPCNENGKLDRVAVERWFGETRGPRVQRRPEGAGRQAT